MSHLLDFLIVCLFLAAVCAVYGLLHLFVYGTF